MLQASEVYYSVCIHILRAVSSSNNHFGKGIGANIFWCYIRIILASFQKNIVNFSLMSSENNNAGSCGSNRNIFVFYDQGIEIII